MSTSVASVVSHFPSAENGFTTTLASTISSGATTVPLNSVAGYTNGETAVFVVDPSDATKKQTFTGVIDTGGVQVTSVVWTAGTNQSHGGGATVVDYATATHISMVTKGLLVEHTQAGRHTMTSPKVTTDISDSSGNELIKVTATASAVNEITLANAATGNDPTITASGGDTNVGFNFTPKGTGVFKIGGNPIGHGAWATWTPTFANFTKGDATITATYTQIGKTVHYALTVVLGSTSSMGTAATFSLPVTSVAVPAMGSGAPSIGLCRVEDNTTRAFHGHVQWQSTTTGLIVYYSVSGTTITGSATSSTAPMTWVSGDAFWCEGTYQAA